MVEIAEVLRKFPWMVEVVKQTPKAFCARDGTVKEVKLELEFSQYETYEDKTREVYRPRDLLAFAAAAREYVRML